VGPAIAACAALSSLPVLPILGDRVASAARYHANRGLQIESTWATLVLVLDRFGLAEAKIEESFGAVQVAGRLPSILCAVSLPVSLLLVAVPTIALARTWWRTGVRRDAGAPVFAGGAEAASRLEHATLAVVLGCMVAGKVLSPQFVLWVAPLLALAATGLSSGMLGFSTAALTTEVYPYLYPALMNQAPGHDCALLALTARNALLIGWYVVAG
jgi:hypothetical protein